MKTLHRLLKAMTTDGEVLEIMKMFEPHTVGFYSHSHVCPNVRIFSFVTSKVYTACDWH
jgi:hypothetical protein